MVGKATMLMQEDAIRVIEEIGRLVSEAPHILLPILQQASISPDELE